MSSQYGDEVIPDSQMPGYDTEMLSLSQASSLAGSSAFSRTSLLKRRRMDLTELREEEEDERRDSQTSTTERGSLDEHLSCGICLSIMDNPFLVLPCMHSYDRECLALWWRKYACV